MLVYSQAIISNMEQKYSAIAVIPGITNSGVQPSDHQ
jgi:hypothetical protein